MPGHGELLAAAHARGFDEDDVAATGVHTSPTATPGRLTRSSTSFSVRNFGTPRNSRTTSGVTDHLFSLVFGDAPAPVCA